MKSLLFILFMYLLSGCYMPAARDDFSVLNDDVFSNVIKSSYTEKVSNNGDGTGVQQINVYAANNFSKKFLVGKTEREVVNFFEEANGDCISKKVEHPSEILTCSVSKKWRLKNIGSKFDTAQWSSPEARLDYEFLLTKRRVIKDLKLQITDITEHSEIYTKSSSIMRYGGLRHERFL